MPAERERATCGYIRRRAAGRRSSRREQRWLRLRMATGPVAYLFLGRSTNGSFFHPPDAAWNRYFAECPRGSFAVHVHVDGGGTQHAAPSGVFQLGAVIPTSVRVKRFAYSIVKAKLLLLRHAPSCAEPANSDSSLPASLEAALPSESAALRGRRTPSVRQTPSLHNPR